MKLNRTIIAAGFALACSNTRAATQCVACEPGKWSNPGATSSSQCSPCTIGYYCISGARIKCANDKYCPQGSSSDSAAWPGGKFRVEINGNVSYENCTSGHWCANGIKTACLAGTYNPNTNSSNQSACLTCTAGHYCQSATVNPTACADGYYAFAGSSSCLQCKVKVYYTEDPYCTNVTDLSTVPSKAYHIFTMGSKKCHNDELGNPYEGKKKYCSVRAKSHETYGCKGYTYTVHPNAISDQDRSDPTFTMSCNKTTGLVTITGKGGTDTIQSM